MPLLLLHAKNSGLVQEGLEAYYELKKSNLLQYSEEFGNAVWGTGPVTSDQAVSPRGDLTADDVADESAVATETYAQSTPVLSSSDTYIFSLYVKKDAEESRFPEYGLELTGGLTTVKTTVQLNTKTGQVQVTAGGGAATSSDEGAYWRVAVTVTDSDTGNNQALCSISPAFAATLGGAEDSTLTGTVTLWGGQLHTGSSALTYTPTTDNQTVADSSGRAQDGTLGPSVTVESSDPMWRHDRVRFDGADDYVLTPPAITQNRDALTMQIVFKKTAASAADVDRALFGHNAGGSYIRFFTDTKIGFWLAASGTAALVQGSSGAIPDDETWKLMTFRWRSGVIQDQILGRDTQIASTASPAEGTIDTTYRAIGVYAGGNYFDGEVATVLFYRRVLSDAEVAANYKTLKAGLADRGIVLA